MDLTIVDCMRIIKIEKGIDIVLTADDETDEEYTLSGGWSDFDKCCHRQTWKYSQVSRVDICEGYVRFWIET